VEHIVLHPFVLGGQGNAKEPRPRTSLLLNPPASAGEDSRQRHKCGAATESFTETRN
jgi:hypothetical protein